ncbi:MAG: serine hydrolase [Flavobacteriales bacterium]|nr:serine hydrolase [Flavobacteriales bacterium]|tara:strand:- start:19679 stop:20806 length:1128 start_codon:yes stop_codon:yes gene_type:complete
MTCFKLSIKVYVFFALVFLLSLSSCKVARFFIFNFADINDHKKFPKREIEISENTFVFPYAKDEKVPKDLTIKGEKIAFKTFLEENNTVAFLIIKDDSIHYENYFDGYQASSIVPSFSMAKSVTSILIGCAIDDGLIQSVDEPVTNYIPELKENGFDQVNIEHLLQMTSGLDYNEGYSNPFGDVASFYYGRNLRKQLAKMKLKADAGKDFEYLSGNTQILGLVLERALKDQTVSNYLEEKLWKPLQMEYSATWSIDKKKEGLEKTFCCINARARDYAKIGRLYLNRGKWNNEQIISEEWVERSTKLDTSKGSAWFYQYQWWLPSKTGDFMAQGILGQYIYVNPNSNVIIVRLGKNSGKADWWTILSSLGQSYEDN